jgi:hypothetical protein
MSHSPAVEVLIMFAFSFFMAGCVTRTGGQGASGDRVLFDSSGGSTYRNHVKAVPDPAGGAGTVLVAERVAKDSCQMTFVKDGGFFAVPQDYEGNVVLRILVQGKVRLRVAMVSGEKLKSYYRELVGKNEWIEIALPLSDLRDKIPTGDRVNDITLWLLAPEKGAVLDKDARLYLDRAVLRAKAP